MDKVLIALAKLETRLDTSLQHLATKTDIYEIVNRALLDCKNNCNKHLVNDNIIISKNHAKAMIAIITAISAVIVYLFQ